MAHAVRAFFEPSPLISKCYRLRVTYTWYLVDQVDQYDCHRNENTTSNIHMMCRKICILNSSIPCLSLFWSTWTMDVDTATLTVYRVIFPTMATRNWFSTCTSQAIIVADNGHRWTRLTMHFVQKFLSISMITSLLSPTIAIDRYLPQSIVTDNMYR